MTKLRHCELITFLIIVTSLASVLSLTKPLNAAEVIRTKRQSAHNFISLDGKEKIMLHFDRVKNHLGGLKVAFSSHKSGSNYSTCDGKPCSHNHHHHSNVSVISPCNSTTSHHHHNHHHHINIDFHDCNQKNKTNVNETTTTTTTTPFQQSLPTCNLSIDKVIQLDAAISDELTKHDLANDIKCDVNENNMDNACHELIVFMECSIDELHNGFTGEAISVKKFTNLFGKYEIISRLYQEFHDNNLELFTAENAEKFDELMNKLRDLQDAKKDLQITLQNNVITAIAENIKAEKSDKAVKVFKDAYKAGLNVELIIVNVVDQTYSLELIINIVVFLKGLPSHSFTMMGLEKIYEIMEKNDQIGNKSAIVLIYDIVTIELADVDGFDNFKRKLTESYMFITLNIANEVREKQDCKILSTESVNERHLNAVLREVYKTEFDLEFLLHCASEFSLKDSSMSLSVLYDEMKRKNEIDTSHIFTITNNVVVIMNNSEVVSLPQKYKNINENLIENLPNTVIGIILNQNNCVLKNVAFNEYLYASEEFYERSRRMLYTSAEKSQSSTWALQLKDASGQFNITNRYFDGEFMMADFSRTDSDDIHYVFTNTRKMKDDSNRDFWLFEPNADGKTFKIKNAEYNQYLLASADLTSDQKRRIYAGNLDENTKDVSDWEIDCHSE